jgi:hypothetical protein
VKSKNEYSKTEAPTPKQESSVSDLKVIEIDEVCCMSFCLKFKYLSYFASELNDTVDITERGISLARKLFNSIQFNSISEPAPPQQQKDPDRDPSQALQAIVANIALWGIESWARKEENSTKLETFHNSCLRRMCNLTMWDIAETQKTRTKRLEEVLQTHPQWNR